MPSDLVRTKANRFLRLHPLRAADAFQLASVLVATEDLASEVSFITFDEQLARDARKEGLKVVSLESA